MLTEWQIKVEYIGVAHPDEGMNIPSQTIIKGRLLKGSMQELGPDGLGLDLDRIPCQLRTPEEVLMNLTLSSGAFTPSSMVQGNLYNFTCDDVVPSRYRELVDGPGLLIELRA